MNVQRLIKLGLGKGLDVTDPQHEWSPKPSLLESPKPSVLARSISSDNVEITGAEIPTKYGQQVLETWSALQREILTVMEEQETTINTHFRTDVQTSNGSKNIIVFKQSTAKTIAFRELATTSDFETSLCSYLCHQFCCTLSKDSTKESQHSPVSVINDLILSLKRTKNESYLQEITKGCLEFLATQQTTHYVSALDLGTMQYSTYSTSQYIEKLGSAIGPMGGPLESGIISRLEAENKLDRMNFEHTVGKESEVIGFYVQPVYMLVKQDGVREQLQIALRQYVHDKLTEDNDYSYHTIAGVTERAQKVYWTVNQRNEIMGTASRQQASLFQFQTAGTKENPSQFLIRCKLRCNNQHNQYNYLKFVTEVTSNTQSLVMTSHIGERFSLHQLEKASLLYLCTATVKTLQDWEEGEALNLKGHWNGFVGMKCTETHNTYKICCAPILQKKSSYTRFCITSTRKGDARVETAAAPWEEETLRRLMDNYRKHSHE